MQALMTTEEATHAVTFRTIVVATDGSADAHLALNAAVDLARRSGAALHLVTAYEKPPVAVYMTSSLAYLGPDDSPDPFEAAAQGLLERERARVERLGVPVVGLHAAWGPVLDVIVTMAGTVDADLIVVGSRDLGALRRLLAGSVSTHVLHSTHRPVLIVRGGPDCWPPAHVVVGFDRSPASHRAAAVAAAMARLYSDATVELVEVTPDPPQQASMYFSFSEGMKVEHALLDLTAEVLEHDAGHTVTATVAKGDPGSALVAHAADRTGPSLIAVGTRGLGGVRRFFLGSVSTKILHSGHTPLLVVPSVVDSVPSRAASGRDAPEIPATAAN